VHGQLTFDEIISACSCALIPQPVMMMLVSDTRFRVEITRHSHDGGDEGSLALSGQKDPEHTSSPP